MAVSTKPRPFWTDHFKMRYTPRCEHGRVVAGLVETYHRLDVVVAEPLKDEPCYRLHEADGFSFLPGGSEWNE
jgi:hypothetical protein